MPGTFIWYLGVWDHETEYQLKSLEKMVANAGFPDPIVRIQFNFDTIYPEITLDSTG